MPQFDENLSLRSRRRGHVWAVATLSLGLTACAPSAKGPWSGFESATTAEHESVRTLNPNYERTRSRVLVREVLRPTRAALDYAVYHQNFMNADPPPEDQQPVSGDADTSNPFGGLVERASLTADIEQTGLAKDERRAPLAFAPLAEFLAAKKVEGAEAWQELGAKVRDESFGLPKQPGLATQSISEVFLHAVADKPASEVIVKIEFAPWFRGLGALPDQDGDGYPEVYGRVKPGVLGAPALEFVQREYAGRELSEAEVKGWANELASYWYPSYNTDLVPPGAVFPSASTEPEVVAELGGRTFPSPTVVMRGKPQGAAMYNVLLVKGATGAASASTGRGRVALKKTKPTPDTKPLADAIGAELAAQGGSWEKWLKSVAPAQELMRKRAKSGPKEVKATAGAHGFLFFKKSLEYASAGEFEKQRRGKNPLPVIVEFKNALAARGVDFLFVPVPTKEELFPDELDPSLKPFVGKVIQPYSRKFLLSLAAAGVETVDLLTPFLAERASGDKPEPLYQKQDTHWTHRGLALAARVLAQRIRRYPWYAELSRHAEPFTTKPAAFTRFGDLHSRLADAEKPKYQPESLLAQQVLRKDGRVYEDDPDSPIVMLGDSYTGVYQLTDAEHAGVSAHLAKGVSYPVDLVMSYGGGPNVRNKLLSRGADDLNHKKVVIWLMTARDLYDYWEDWEPLVAK
jgi:hypothetical protein